MFYAFDAQKQVYVDAFMSLNNVCHLFRAKQVHMDGSRTCKQTKKSLLTSLMLTLGVNDGITWICYLCETRFRSRSRLVCMSLKMTLRSYEAAPLKREITFSYQNI